MIPTEKLEALIAAATPGPWEVDDPNTTLVASRGEDGCYEYICAVHPDEFSTTNRTNEENNANASLIALTPTLATEVLSSRKRIAEMETAIRTFIAEAPIGDDDQPYCSDVMQSEFKALIRSLKDATP